MSSYSAGERELVELLENSAGQWTLVLLGEPWHPGTGTMSQRLREHGRAMEARLIELPLASYSDWARGHGVVAVPTTLVFRGPRLVGRIPGILEEQEVGDILARFALESS